MQRDMHSFLLLRAMCQMVKSSTGRGNQEQTLVSEEYMTMLLESYVISTTGSLSYILYITVVSAEQYAEPPSADLHFPNKEDLINYTKSKDMSEIIIPSTLVREKLEEENDGKCMH